MKIFISVVLVLFLVACSDDSSSKSVQQKAPVATQTVVDKVAVVQESVPEAATVAVETPKEITEVTQEVKAELAPVKSGADMFKACASCHGLNDEKKALNKSQVIQGWSEVQTLTALNGYKDGSYGAAMKCLMKSQVIKLSDEDVATLSKYISEL